MVTPSGVDPFGFCLISAISAISAGQSKSVSPIKMDNDNTLFDATPSSDEIKQELEAMPFEKLKKIALDIQELLKHDNVSSSIRPVIVSVINELQRRKELLVAALMCS